MRAGTETVHNIAGMEVAFNLCYKNLDKNTEKLKNLKQYFIHQLKHHFPEIVFNGTSESLEESSYAIVNVGFPALQHQDNTLLFQLDLKGIACSHVLSAFMPKEALQYPSLRFSFSAFNTIEEVDFLIESLKEISLNKY